jgi:hypothetical protein
LCAEKSKPAYPAWLSINACGGTALSAEVDAAAADGHAAENECAYVGERSRGVADEDPLKDVPDGTVRGEAGAERLALPAESLRPHTLVA